MPCLEVADRRPATALSVQSIRGGLLHARQQTRPPAAGVVVIPTYNEAENIARLIYALQALPEPYDILIVDDNSPDGTAGLVRGLMAQVEGLYLLTRPAKNGLGNAYKAGFRWALQQGWDYLVQMDADFSHDPQDVPRLRSCCQTGADVAIGSRYVKGGRIVGWPWRRWLLSRTANLFAQVLLGHGLADMTAGFKCFRRTALAAVGLEHIASDGYVFQVEVNHRARRAGLKLAQCPIRFVDRRRGVSKMGAAEARQGLRCLLRLRASRRGMVERRATAAWAKARMAQSRIANTATHNTVMHSYTTR